MKKWMEQHLKDILIFITLIQVLFLLLSLSNLYINDSEINKLMGVSSYDHDKYAIIIILASLSLSFTIIYLVYQLVKKADLEKELANKIISHEMAQNTIHLLRCHRHDFLNHLQVIMGYIQLGKSNSALEYIKNINPELKDIQIISELQVPEVAVLLFTKRQEAMLYEIKLVYDIRTDLCNIVINQVDLVRILSNLIDNAIFEMKKSSDKQKILKVSFDLQDNKLHIKVNNTGSLIKHEDIQKIFQYGYSTKGSKGSGIGLYNVKELVEKKYKGKVTVESNEIDGTTFIIVV